MTVIMRSSASIEGSSYPSPGFTSMWWVPGTVGGSTADATDILARFRACWDSVKANIHTSVSINFDPICIAVEATTGVLTGAFAGTDPSTVAGTGATDALPLQTQALIRLRTNTVINGRRVRGRLFVPGQLEANNSGAGVLSSSLITALAGGFASILAAGGTASAPCIWHRPSPLQVGASPAVASVECAPTWSVLRSRR